MQLSTCLLFSLTVFASASGTGCTGEPASEHLAMVQRQASWYATTPTPEEEAAPTTTTEAPDPATVLCPDATIQDTLNSFKTVDAWKNLLKTVQKVPGQYINAPHSKDESVCKLWGGDWNETGGAHLVVADPFDEELMTCCASNEGHSREDWMDEPLPQLDEHYYKDYKYYTYTPDYCKSRKCPMVLDFNFTRDTGRVHEMIQCPSCRKDMAAVALLPVWWMWQERQPQIDPTVNVSDAPLTPRYWITEGFISEYLRGMVSEAISSHNVDSSEVYVSGCSLGSVAALTTALGMPDVFKMAYIASPSTYGSSIWQAHILGALTSSKKKFAGSHRLERINLFLAEMDDTKVAADGTAGQKNDDPTAELDWGILASTLADLGVISSTSSTTVKFHMMHEAAHASGWSNIQQDVLLKKGSASSKMLACKKNCKKSS